MRWRWPPGLLSVAWYLGFGGFGAGFRHAGRRGFGPELGDRLCRFASKILLCSVGVGDERRKAGSSSFCFSDLFSFSLVSGLSHPAPFNLENFRPVFFSPPCFFFLFFLFFSPPSLSSSPFCFYSVILPFVGSLPLGGPRRALFSRFSPFKSDLLSRFVCAHVFHISTPVNLVAVPLDVLVVWIFVMEAFWIVCYWILSLCTL